MLQWIQNLCDVFIFGKSLNFEYAYLGLFNTDPYNMTKSTARSSSIMNLTCATSCSLQIYIPEH